MKDSLSRRLASLGVRDGSLGESTPAPISPSGSDPAMASHFRVAIHSTRGGLQPAAAPEASLARLPPLIITSSAVASHLMDQLSRVWHRQPWRLRAGVRLGKEEDALGALAA